MARGALLPGLWLWRRPGRHHIPAVPAPAMQDDMVDIHTHSVQFFQIAGQPPERFVG